MESQVKTKIESMVQDILLPEPGCFLVELRLLPGNSIKIFLDGDQGISISQCASCSRILYKRIEEAGLFPESDFSMEVSSAGVGEPLKLIRQYQKNKGRHVEVVLNDLSRLEGRLADLTEDGIVLELTTGKGKKKEVENKVILFDNIKTTKVQIVF